MTADRRHIDEATMAQTYNRDAHAFHDQAKQLVTWTDIGGPAIDRFVGNISNLTEAKIWDQGSASGRVVERIIEGGAKPQNIVGVELSPDQVAIARKAFPLVDFRVGNLATTQMEEACFDAATQHMVGEHLDDETLAAVNKNTFKALKPGGKYMVILTHPEKTAVSSGLTESGSFMTTFPWGGEGLNYHRTKEDLLKAYKDAGFVIDNVEDLHLPDSARESHPEEFAKYQKYPHLRIAIEMHKPQLTATP